MNLLTAHCTPNAPALGEADIAALLAQLPLWQAAGHRLERVFHFKNYHHTMAFVNALAWISHQQDHHPELLVTYKECAVRYQTHSAGGALTANDFICAARANALIAEQAGA